MKLSIRTSGGFGNIRLQGQLDTDQLDSALAARVHSALRPERLGSIAPSPSSPVADAVQYEVTLFAEKGVQRFLVDEAAAPADVQEALRALVKEIVRRRRRGE
jgi:hypothetical protein